ncbi:hypothetical protein [Silanimonas sp.]|uniref:hypothetical protein n=1 Tax=Silanimonas sp. TaxID=1929290 RepID=UPI0022C14DBC|nr:hypothetical protein [Silanimonas sp.]MCZ8166936.1 hypothetical protein [Silanimonas sp.]
MAPNAKLRPLVVPQQPPAQAQTASEAAAPAECEVQMVPARPNRISWARLLKRVLDIDMQHCPNCGGGLKIIAAILERPVIEKILCHLGLDPQPPPRGRVREAGQDFAARAALTVKDTSPQAALTTAARMALRRMSARCRWTLRQP